MAFSAYLFEIRQIQGFVFSTGKLRDASGASELLDGLSGDVSVQADASGQTIAVSGLAGQLIELFLPTMPRTRIYRAAGGAIDLTCDDLASLRKFRAAFRLALGQRAPGLVYNDNIASHDDMETARMMARMGMSDGGPVRGANLPLGSPMVRPAPKSGGNPAVLPGWSKGGKCRITKDFADLATQLKRRHLDEQKQTLTVKFTPPVEEDRPAPKWPNVFSVAEDKDASERNVVFPFDGKDVPRIAVVHADGNGMGKLFAAAVGKLHSDEVRKLSRALAEATQGAVRAAMGPVVDKRSNSGVVPARPIVLGGDDVSLLLRADLALDFARDFAVAFQDLATAAVRSFAGLEDWNLLTTKIGLVVIGPNQPFQQAYALAESLASSARDGTESRIAFCRITSAAIPATVEELEQDGVAAEGFTLWRSAHSLHQISALRALARRLGDDDVGRGGLRRVPELLKTDRNRAHGVLDRALVVLKDRNPKTHEALMTELQAVGMPDLSVPGNADNPIWCPLLQAHDLAHIERTA